MALTALFVALGIAQGATIGGLKGAGVALCSVNLGLLAWSGARSARLYREAHYREALSRARLSQLLTNLVMARNVARQHAGRNN